MGGALMMFLVLVIMAGITAYLVGTMIQSIRNEKRGNAKLFKNFGLGLAFCLLFVISWGGQAISEWQLFTDQQTDHNQPVAIGDFMAQFSQSTLENWQSEFLQLFSFTVMAAVLIHKGSAESRDSDDRLEAALQRIEKRLGTDPRDGEGADDSTRTFHVVWAEGDGWAVTDSSSSEPEAYYRTKQEATEAAKKLAADEGGEYVVHTKKESTTA